MAEQATRCFPLAYFLALSSRQEETKEILHPMQMVDSNTDLLCGSIGREDTFFATFSSSEEELPKPTAGVTIQR